MERLDSTREIFPRLGLPIVFGILASASNGQFVEFQNFSSTKGASNTLSITAARPPNTVAGDLLIAAVATDGNTASSLSAPVGWTPISIETELAVTLGVWWKIAGTSEPTSYQFTWGLGEQSYAWIMRFSGHDPDNPINAVNTRGGTASLPSSPGVTTTVDDSLILRLGAFDDPSVNVGQTGLGGSHTAITMDRSSTTIGQAVSGGAGYRLLAVAGSSGGANFSLTSTQEYRTVTIAIAPDRCTSHAECDDGNICTTDVCNDGFCENTNNNASCDDGNACTIGDTCSGGVCQGGSPVDCSAAGDQCNTASCDPAGTEGNCDTLTPVTNGTSCADGDACIVGETCQDGACTGGSAPDCSGAGDQCNTASCDLAGTEGNCDTLTPVTNGTSCDDGLFCTAADECVDGACVGSGDACPGQVCVELSDECVECVTDGDCEDGVGCTDDMCVDNVCVFTANDAHCDDGLFCNGSETCDAALDCVSGAFPCDDGLECTENLCDEVTDSCTFAPDDALCDDSNPCTVDTCNEGFCEYDLDGLITIELHVQGLSNMVTRNVTLVVTNCTGSTDARDVPVLFDGFGNATVQLTGVDADSTWISVREGHTLRELAPLTFVDCTALVNFTGGSALRSGDFQAGAATQDNIVDITDFSILASRWNTPVDPNLSTGADVTGDGLQSTADFTAIQANFLQIGDSIDGCAMSIMERTSGALSRDTVNRRWTSARDAHRRDSGAGIKWRGPGAHVSRAHDERMDLDVRKLRSDGTTRVPTAHMPIPHARDADINDDGVIDARDIRAFAEIHNLPLLSEFDELLSQLECVERNESRR